MQQAPPIAQKKIEPDFVCHSRNFIARLAADTPCSSFSLRNRFKRACISDEYTGLPSGFLYAGSTSVVSFLCEVSDISTTFLITKFYDNLQQGLSVAVALNQAQRWLRDATGDELQQWMEEQKLPLNPTLKMSLQRRFRQNRYPFQSSFYWAAFCAVGQ